MESVGAEILQRHKQGTGIRNVWQGVEGPGCSPGVLGKGRPVESMAGHSHLRQEYWAGNQV